MSSTPKFYDRVQESSTTTGTGTYTLAGAITGFQSFSALGNGNSCHYCAQEVDGNGNPSGGWEVGVGTYTASGTTLSRDVIVASSNSNAAVSWAAGTRRIFIVAPASIVTPSGEMNGRLTTESGVPVSTSDRTAQGTIYYTPFNGNVVTLFDGFGWRRYRFSELSLALTATSGKNYDVFVYDNAGTLTLELSAAWTNDTTRADALALQDGIYVKSGTTTRRWLGTIRASGSNVTADSGGGVTTQVGGKRFVWNAYNRVEREIAVIDTTATWTYNGANWQQADAASGNKVEYVCGAAIDAIDITAISTVAIGNTSPAHLGIGVDSTTSAAGVRHAHNASSALDGVLTATYRGIPGLGYHVLYWLEAGYSGASLTWTGYISSGGNASRQSGMSGRVWA